MHIIQKYHTIQMGSYLHRPGLYQMAIIGDCQLDKSLLTALVETWRPETSTFHLPVDEMTVVLEDVCFLWGLPIRGIFFNILFYILFFNFTNLILKYKKCRKTNNKGD
jgi:Plant mobile domain